MTYRDFELWMSENGYHADDDAADVFDFFCTEYALSSEEADRIWYGETNADVE